jgi:peptide/nickel transport system substrate-binding protein
MGSEWSEFYKKFLRGQLPLAFLTWGSYSIFDASAILNPFFMNNAPGCYGTTPEIDRILKEANNTLDQENRKAYFSKAQKIIAEEAFWAPLCTTRPLSIMKKNLVFQPSYDEIDRYFTATWKKKPESKSEQSLKRK